MTDLPARAADEEPIRVDRLAGPYGGLHSFARFPIVVDGTVWPTMEHYIQAQKHTGSPLADLIRQAATPRTARKLGNDPAAAPIAGWASTRAAVTRRACEAKLIQHPRLLATLLATGDRPLLADIHTGQPDRDAGSRNILGQLLMALRTELHEPSFAARRAMQQLPPELAGQPWVLFDHHLVAVPRRPTTTDIAVSGLHLLRHVAELARQPTAINSPAARWTTGLGTLMLLAAAPDPNTALTHVLQTAVCANVSYVDIGRPLLAHGQPRAAGNTG